MAESRFAVESLHRVAEQTARDPDVEHLTEVALAARRRLPGGEITGRIESQGGEAVCFTGRDDGWAARGRYVYRTTDGGLTWHDQYSYTVPR